MELWQQMSPKELYKADVVISVGSRISMDSVAHNLFRALRDFDEENVDFIYSETLIQVAAALLL